MSSQTLSEAKPWTSHELGQFLLESPDCLIHVVGITDDFNIAGGHYIGIEQNARNIMLIGSKTKEEDDE
jgi:hypothetical protein